MKGTAPIHLWRPFCTVLTLYPLPLRCIAPRSPLLLGWAQARHLSDLSNLAQQILFALLNSLEGFERIASRSS